MEKSFGYQGKKGRHNFDYIILPPDHWKWQRGYKLCTCTYSGYPDHVIGRFKTIKFARLVAEKMDKKKGRDIIESVRLIQHRRSQLEWQQPESLRPVSRRELKRFMEKATGIVVKPTDIRFAQKLIKLGEISFTGY
jgi:hypothetical protein